MDTRVAIVGAGLIGRAWAIVFARAGADVALHDISAKALAAAHEAVAGALADLAAYGLIADAQEVRRRVGYVDDLGEALDGRDYIQECGPERVEVKREIFARLDGAAAADAVLASSSSGIAASAFTEGLRGRGRCLVAHPVNPPYLLPLVELVPAPWTDTAVVDRAEALLRAAGQVPIRVRNEVGGFVLNRLQGALLNEAFRLVEDGCVSAEDLDKTVAHGLGPRWSFMGPFETIDLNAPGGLRDYAERYGPMYRRLAQEQADPRPWAPALVETLERERRARLPRERLESRQAWRDRRLMALAAHKRAADIDIGS